MRTALRSPAADEYRLVDPLSVLMRDHAALMPCIRELSRSAPAGRAEAERHEELVGRLCADWNAHLQLDEELFVPAARKALGAMGMPPGPMAWDPRPSRALIEQLDEMAPEDPAQARVLLQLTQLILAHCREEQAVLFPRLRDGGRLDPALGRALALRRAALRADITGHAPLPRLRGAWPPPCRLALGNGLGALAVGPA